MGQKAYGNREAMHEACRLRIEDRQRVEGRLEVGREE